MVKLRTFYLQKYWSFLFTEKGLCLQRDFKRKRKNKRKCWSFLTLEVELLSERGDNIKGERSQRGHSVIHGNCGAYHLDKGTWERRLKEVRGLFKYYRTDTLNGRLLSNTSDNCHGYRHRHHRNVNHKYLHVKNHTTDKGSIICE